MAANNWLENYNGQKSADLLAEAFLTQSEAVAEQTRAQQWMAESAALLDESEVLPTNVSTEIESIEIQGHKYIGLLSIPALGVSLPVNADISYPLLKAAPCRYNGAVETDNLIIAAHNYTGHFGRIDKLKPGDKITLSAPDGTVINYSVRELITLPGNAVKEMLSPDGWDLTLFTCTYSGLERITLRCEREDREL
jgi:sortase A